MYLFDTINNIRLLVCCSSPMIDCIVVCTMRLNFLERHRSSKLFLTWRFLFLFLERIVAIWILGSSLLSHRPSYFNPNIKVSPFDSCAPAWAVFTRENAGSNYSGQILIYLDIHARARKWMKLYIYIFAHIKYMLLYFVYKYHVQITFLYVVIWERVVLSCLISQITPNFDLKKKKNVLRVVRHGLRYSMVHSKSKFGIIILIF